MIYFITGSSGFVGKELLRQLKLQRKKVFCIKNVLSKQEQTDGFYLTYAQFFNQNVNDSYYFFHLAAKIKGSHQALFKVNYELSRKILEKIKSEHCVKFVYFSSFDVETDILSDYASSKLAFEKHLISNFKNYLIIRPSVIYGYGDTKNFQHVFNLLKVLPIAILPNYGQTLFRPIHVKTLIRIVTKQLLKKHGIYTIISKNIFSLEKIVTAYLQSHQQKTHVLKIPFKLGLPISKVKITLEPSRNIFITNDNIIIWIKNNTCKI